MSSYPDVTTDREHTFIDYGTGHEHTLIIGDDRASTGVRHDGCVSLADVSPELDCAYCSPCGWQCRLSGAWFMDLWRVAGVTEGAE